jgi:DNA polymerase I-like protein with 3'-5' exonuclease and polymerase domains
LVKELKRHKMKTLIVGQIHDSIIADVPENELEDFLGLARDVMTTQLMDKWKWMVVPLEVEAEVCPIGGSWADKKEMEIPK